MRESGDVVTEAVQDHADLGRLPGISDRRHLFLLLCVSSADAGMGTELRSQGALQEA